MRDDIGEKCGVVGVYTSGDHATVYAKRGLAALQHRGQESAGLSVLTTGKKIKTYKHMGLVPHVLTDDVLRKLGKSKFAIGHNRYATSGKSSTNNAQPITVKHGKFELSIGHNGNVPDVSNIKKHLGEKKSHMTDTALMATLLLKERPNFSSWAETLKAILPEFKGAYCLTILTNDGSLFAVRDPYGIRPLCLGRLPDGWIVASESVSLDSIGADFIRDIKPGEIVKIDEHGKINSYFFGEAKHPQHCLFEYIYFARPDSFLNDRRIRQGREESGRLLGERIKKKNIHADVVVPTFDSGYAAAKGVAEVLNLPIVDAITTSHYVGRTFIQPGQENRIAAVNGKHNIVPDEIVGKKIIVVDDSAVRLTTSTILAKGFRNAGAKEVYMAFASPPVVDQCDMGIDMRSKKHLPAAQFEKQPFDSIEKNVAKLINADEVIYLPIEETALAMGGVKKDFYYTPFGGPHPIRSKQKHFPKTHKTVEGKIKMLVFLSGGGTNLQKIIDGVEQQEIDAEIIGVLSHKADALGLNRAKKHHIPATILPYSGKLSDSDARKKYDEQLIAYVKKLNPDLVVLAGWMMVLGDNFLQKMQEMKIPVVNLHPALMTQKFEKDVLTSRGRIPVLRGIGTQIIKETFEKNFPVSGVTIHQLLPGNNYDVGPIIMKAEFRRKAHDTLETWEKKLHETEHMMLPTAIERVIHVMKQDIDISQGNFPW